MRKTILDSELLADRFDCFGQYDGDDTICRNWCQLNIRCAIVQHQYEELEILEDLFDTELETDRLQ
jgi:hypothetical protein